MMLQVNMPCEEMIKFKLSSYVSKIFVSMIVTLETVNVAKECFYHSNKTCLRAMCYLLM